MRSLYKYGPRELSSFERRRPYFKWRFRSSVWCVLGFFFLAESPGASARQHSNDECRLTFTFLFLSFRLDCRQICGPHLMRPHVQGWSRHRRERERERERERKPNYWDAASLFRLDFIELGSVADELLLGFTGFLPGFPMVVCSCIVYRWLQPWLSLLFCARPNANDQSESEASVTSSNGSLSASCETKSMRSRAIEKIGRNHESVLRDNVSFDERERATKFPEFDHFSQIYGWPPHGSVFCLVSSDRCRVLTQLFEIRFGLDGLKG